MKSMKNVFGLPAGGAATIALYACSANSGDPSAFGQTTGNGQGNFAGFGYDASIGNGGFGGFDPNSGTGNSGPIFGPMGGSAGTRPTGGDACPAIRQKPETVIVYKDASVTDTIYT